MQHHCTQQSEFLDARASENPAPDSRRQLCQSICSRDTLPARSETQIVCSG
jgi:hypothetical protein